MSATREDGSRSFYLFDIDDNLLFLTTELYLWNAETGEELAVSSGKFAEVQPRLGQTGEWHAWSAGERTFRDFRDQPGVAPRDQQFVKDLIKAIDGGGKWQGPSWPLLVHAATNQRAIAVVTARGHHPATIKAGLEVLAERGLIEAVPPILNLYTVTNEEVRAQVGAADPALTVPSVKKLAIKHAVKTALDTYGHDAPHRFGMSDDDLGNVALAISAMRDCKLDHPDKRFFVINTNHIEFVKLEVFKMEHPATAQATSQPLL